MIIKTLRNGLKVAIEKNGTADKTQIGFYILGGRYTENKKSLQYYHMLEHLLAYFTSQDWPDARKNRSKLHRKGIQYYSTADDYETHIYLKGDSEHSELMLDMVTSTLSRFQLDETVFNQEKAAVELELSNQLSQPFTRMDDEINKIMTPDHILSVSTRKNFKFIESMTFDEVSNFAQHALTPERILFYMTGNAPKSSTFVEYKHRLQSIPEVQPVFSIRSLLKYDPDKSNPIEPGIYHIKLPTLTTRVQLRWKLNVTAFEYAEVAIVDVLSYCLQKRLTDVLRTELGLVYSIVVRSFFDPINKNMSYLYIETDSIFSEKSKSIVLEIIRILDTPLLMFTNEVIDEYKRLERRKFETTKLTGVLLNASRLLWNQEVVTASDLLEYSNSVTQDQVLKTYEQYFSTDAVYLIYGGPHDIFKGM